MEFNDFIIRSKIPNFEIVKNEILSSIDNLPKMSYEYEYDKISNTDYFSDHYFKNLKDREKYMEPLEQHVKTHCGKLMDLNKYRKTQITSFWFQQYEYGDRHHIHTHPDSNIANVIYIELPNKDSATKFIWKGKEYSIDVEEGEIISFPSMFAHYSPPNYGKRKTIISFNIEAG